MYPQRLQLSKIPGIDISVQIFGPAVLMIVFALFLLKFVPDPPQDKTWQLLVPHENGQAATYRFSTTELRAFGKDFQFRLLGEASGQLVGVFVAFEPGDSLYEGEFTAGLRKGVKVSFKRDEGFFNVNP
jgi:hypothetical protein